MVRCLVAAFAGVLGLAGTARAADADAQMDRYFSIWADNARVTPAAVERLYASRVLYYGKPMTSTQVYRDKIVFIRQWPDRRYGVVPGSVSKSCDAAQASCEIFAVLRWQKSDPRTGRGSRGANAIRLGLVRQDGMLKIARESGTAVALSACQNEIGQWTCSAYR